MRMFDRFTFIPNAPHCTPSRERALNVSSRKRQRGVQKNFCDVFRLIIMKILQRMCLKIVNYMQWKWMPCRQISRVFYTAVQRLESSSPISLTNVKAGCCTKSSTEMSNFLFNTCRASSRTNCGRLGAALSESRSHPTNSL